MKKIIDSELLSMSESEIPQKEIATHFGVTEAAISKRLKQLRKHASQAAVMDKLTAKEQKFVASICSGVSQTQSAVSAFDVGSYNSAKAIAYKMMKDPDINLAISTIMEMQGLSRSHLIKRLGDHVNGGDPQVSMRGVEMGLKLHDAFPAAKNMNLNVAVEVPAKFDLSGYRNR
jgi:predicted transcriptional regulator